MNQQQQNHYLRMDSSLRAGGYNCILLVPNLRHRLQSKPRFVLNLQQNKKLKEEH